MPKKASVGRVPEEEIDLLDSMLTALVELLEKKGILTQAEWEKHLKSRISIR